jgi:hypothetical protein
MDFTLCSFQRPDAYALAGAKKEWHVSVATPAAPEPHKALKTEQQLLDGKILQPSAYRPVEVS